MYYIVFVLFLVRCPCMAINVSVQYNGGFLVPSGGCRAGLTLESCSQLAVFVIQPVG